MPDSTAKPQRRPAMTGAQRQRKHREKIAREVQALRASVPQKHDESALLYQLQSLRAQLARAEREHKATQERMAAMEVAEFSAQALREAVASMLRALNPAARTAATAPLKSAGVLATLPQAPAPQSPPPSVVSPAAFFKFF